MSYKVKATGKFGRSIKQIEKKHKFIRQDIIELINDPEENPTKGISFGNNLYKIRLSITGSGKGKSGGSSVITYVKITDELVVLADIYLKSDYDTVSEKEILEILNNDGFI